MSFALLAWILATARGRDAALFPPAAGAGAQIYLIDNGFHTDLALPRASVLARGGALAEAAAATTPDPWIVVGGGDERFYTQSGFTAARVADALRALFWPGNPSVLRIEGLPLAPDRVYVRSAVQPIRVSDAGLARLEARVDRSFALGPNGRPEPGSRSEDADRRFFRSGEHFSALHICNHWTSELLNAAGLPTTPVVDTIPAGLRLDLRLRARI